jgi:hypothetical protein
MRIYSCIKDVCMEYWGAAAHFGALDIAGDHSMMGHVA